MWQRAVAQSGLIAEAGLQRVVVVKLWVLSVIQATEMNSGSLTQAQYLAEQKHAKFPDLPKYTTLN